MLDFFPQKMYFLCKFNEEKAYFRLISIHCDTSENKRIQLKLVFHLQNRDLNLKLHFRWVF